MTYTLRFKARMDPLPCMRWTTQIHLCMQHLPTYPLTGSSNGVTLKVCGWKMNRGSGGSRIFQGRVPTPKDEGTNLWFSNIFTENCMKMKETGPPGGGARPWYPLPRSVIVWSTYISNCWIGSKSCSQYKSKYETIISRRRFCHLTQKTEYVK